MNGDAPLLLGDVACTGDVLVRGPFPTPQSRCTASQFRRLPERSPNHESVGIPVAAGSRYRADVLMYRESTTVRLTSYRNPPQPPLCPTHVRTRPQADSRKGRKCSDVNEVNHSVVLFQRGLSTSIASGS